MRGLQQRQERSRPVRSLFRKFVPLFTAIAISACIPAKPVETNHPAVQTKKAKRINELVRLLDSEDPDIRFEASHSILRKAETDPRSLTDHVPALFAALMSGDREVRGRMALSLVKIGEPAAKLAVRGLEAKGLRRALSVFILIRIGKPAVPALLSVLESGKTDMRRVAASLLGNIGDVKALPGLRRAAGDQDRYVREEAIRAIRRILTK